MRVDLRYGCNPHQGQAAFECDDRGAFVIRSGKPSMINMLDALNGWRLVAELQQALDLPAAASFKHVSPAGAALGNWMEDEELLAYEVKGRHLPRLACAYVRARGADPKSSFGDFVALSERVDVNTAEYVRSVVCDGLIAPGFEPGAARILEEKKGGSFVVIEADPAFRPPAVESREVYGVTLTQERNDRRINASDLDNVVCGTLTDDAKRDLVLGLVTMKYTQSNSVGYAWGGQMIGIGAGQQSRVDCTKLAGAKADLWRLRLHPKVLGLAFESGVRRQERINWRGRYIEGDMTPSETQAFAAATGGTATPLSAEERADWLGKLTGVSLVSDGFIPFRDNVEHAQKHGVSFIAQPGGSARDAEVIEACEEYGIAMAHTDLRLFHH